jgi:NAD(P)-dependent dehydrogenase (short-subunit alcohol dehydrogenase family)
MIDSHDARTSSGRTVATSSTAGKTSMGNIWQHCAARWNSIGLGTSLAREAARDGITVSAVVHTGGAHDDPARGGHKLVVPGVTEAATQAFSA